LGLVKVDLDWLGDVGGEREDWVLGFPFVKDFCDALESFGDADVGVGVLLPNCSFDGRVKVSGVAQLWNDLRNLKGTS
jgi:hypothetical protein